MSDVVDVDEAVRLLLVGGVVAVPTDTVYGLAASLEDANAVAQIFAMKRRPGSAALPVLVDMISSIERLGVTWPAVARRLSDSFWPGALTIVVDVPPALARRVGSASDTVGFRLPDDVLLREMLSRTGPLAVSSANEHAEPPCHNAKEVLAAFGTSEFSVAILDGGERSGEVSTVVRVQGSDWQILREGAVSPDEVARALA